MFVYPCGRTRTPHIGTVRRRLCFFCVLMDERVHGIYLGGSKINAAHSKHKVLKQSSGQTQTPVCSLWVLNAAAWRWSDQVCVYGEQELNLTVSIKAQSHTTSSITYCIWTIPSPPSTASAWTTSIGLGKKTFPLVIRLLWPPTIDYLTLVFSIMRI